MAPVTTPKFAFLCLEEHPYAREMLAGLLDGGFRPEVLVQEVGPVADEEREKFLARIAGRPVGPPIAAQSAEHALAVERCPKHTSKRLLPLLEDLDLDLIVLGGTRVIRGAVLDLPRDGVINSHPGLLPDCRGSASPAWSVLHDIPIGASTHFCDSSIDTGDLLLRRELPVARGATYEDLCHATLVLAGQLMREALEAYVRGAWPELRRPQGESPWPTFRNAPEEVLEQVRAKLAEQRYGCYAGA
jgi:methionyl-tRNA formyltransferase